MPTSISNSSELDTTGYGWAWDDLPPHADGPIDLRRVFFGHGDPGRPVELEVGSGKGTFLVDYAAAHPELDLLGVEYARAFYRYAADRARRHALPNGRLLYADAASFLRLYVPSASLRQVHVYFPDPWPKKKHHKRRFVCEANLRELHRVLRGRETDDAEAGKVRLATDHADYFAWMEEAAAACDDAFERLAFERPGSGEADEWVGTNFERKYRREGRPFHGMILRKR